MIHIQKFTFSPIQENTYLLWNEKGHALIIDPGCYFTAEQETLHQFIKDHQLTPVQLLNTHCHLDHVFGNKWVSKTFNLELYIQPKEEQVLQFAPNSGLMWGLSFENYTGPLHFINAGDTIYLDEDELQVILAPGHSPGHVCFYCKAQQFIIGGDVLFLESIGRTDLPGGNHQQLLNSIREQLFVLPDATVVHPGHGPQTTIGHEKKYNPYLQM
ncbi:MBL fold metallo-hydrolase [Limnovirga soli]|uniref:MBL fold metallo-hydrolase n=1 Tax=Limnovirga soli TaxID=2656915 RepID=A0A8J8FDW6_9BACT|nr:MBL fold metallo-hydrolase [Limnovirga soli]NNV55900.1 MBL fold metallo-hydrolase [Limnovirga soli]